MSGEVEKPDKRVLEIRLDNLEACAQQQPQLLYEWGVKKAKAEMAVKSAKNQLKLVEAEVAQEVRQTPGAFDLPDKPTVGAVEQAVHSSTRYQQMLTALHQTEYELDVIAAFVSALYDRKEEIGNLVKLHGQMYFSKPDTKVDPAPAMAEVGKRLNRPRNMRG